MRKLVFGSQVLVVPVFMLLWVTLLVLAPVSEQLAPLILQGPPYVFEGDSMLLRCRTKAKTELNTVVFFKNGERLMLPNNSSDLHIDDADLVHNGHYHCGGYIHTCCAASSNRVSIQIRVLFPRPVLRSSSSKPTEGSPVTLTCQTQLPPERSDVQLQFCFFRDSQALGSGWRSSPKLRIPALGTEDSGSYWCQAKRVNSHLLKESWKISITVWAAVSQPVLTLNPAKNWLLEGTWLTLHCEVQRGSPPILYKFYHDSVSLGSSSTPSTGRASLGISLTAQHSGFYYCTADNGFSPQRSEAVRLSVLVPVSRPVLTLRDPSIRLVVGDVMELHCESLSGSPPILYKFYHEDVTLGSTMSPSGGGASFNLSLMEKHSGNYSCEAENDLEIQHSELVTVIVTVPVSRPVLTLRAPRAQAEVGDVVELHCEALRGSPPILYQFYHEDVTLGNSSAPSGGGASFNLSLTAEHSGNYSCEADNGQGAQRSEAVALFIPGLTESRSGPVAPGVTGGLLGMVVLAAGALLFYHWLSRKAGGRTASDPSRHSSDSNPQDPTYHNVPGWIELQPVYMNVNSRGEDVVYSEVSCLQKESRNSAASAHSLSHQTDSSVIYAKVKKACTPASGPHQLASPAPHR
nr:Fc receptor-like protein 5 isoform X3 [Marmota flaviventris]